MLRLKGERTFIPVLYQGPRNPEPYRDLAVTWIVAEPWQLYGPLKVGKYFDLFENDEFIGHGQVVTRREAKPSDETA